MLYRATIEGETIDVELAGGRILAVDGTDVLLGIPLGEWTVEPLPDGYLLLAGGRVVELCTTTNGSFVAHGTARAAVQVLAPHDRIRGAVGGAGGSDLELRAPMPGKVVKVAISEGDKLTEGDLLLVIEAMKMQNELRTSAPCEVGRIEVEEGQSVEGNELLVTFVELNS